MIAQYASKRIKALSVKIWELFNGLDRAYGTYVVMDKEGKKLSGQARTLQQPVTQDVWDLHLSGERSLGVIPIRDDNTCVFAAIDIDTYPLEHEDIEEKIESLKLPLIITRSKSGGAHLYLFIKPPGAVAEVARQRMAEWAAELGFSGVEIFPKQDELRNKDDVGNWINMPYFGGNEDTLRYAFINGKPATLEQFEKAATKKAIPAEQLKQFQVTIADNELLKYGPPCLQSLLRDGFPRGNRNISLFNLGVLCRKKYDDDWQDKIDEMNEEFMQPPLSPGEVAQIKRNLEKKTYFYKCNDAPINAVCQRSICKTRKFGIGGDALDDPEGFKLEGPIRILTEDIYYIVTIDGRRVSLTNREICSFPSFRMSIVNQTGFLPPLMKARQFDAMMQRMTLDAQEVEAVKHSGKRGTVMQELLQIASGANTAESWAQCMSGLPLPDGNGGMYFYPHQLVKILKRRLSLRDLKPQELFEVLMGEGVEVKEEKKGGRMFWQIHNLFLHEDITEEEPL